MSTSDLEGQLITLRETLEAQIRIAEELSTTVSQELDEVLTEVEVNRVAINTKVATTTFDSRVEYVDDELSKRALSVDMIASLGTKVDTSEYTDKVALIDSTLNSLDTNKADKNATAAALALKADQAATQAALDLKADLSYVNAQLNTKVDKNLYTLELAAANTAIATKASNAEFQTFKTNTDATLLTKADKTTTEAAIATKVDQSVYNTAITGLQASIDQKANQTFVVSQIDTINNQIALKADKTYVDATLTTKVNKSTYDLKMTEIDAILAVVVDDAEFATEIQDITDILNLKAEKTYVDAQLSTKANSTEVNQRIASLKIGGAPIENNVATSGSCGLYPGNPTSLNQFVMFGLWDYNLSMTENPGFAGTVFVVHDAEAGKLSQVAFGTELARFAIRSLNSGVWSSWNYMVDLATFQAVTDSLVQKASPVVLAAIKLWQKCLLDGLATSSLNLRLNQYQDTNNYKASENGIPSVIGQRYTGTITEAFIDIANRTYAKDETVSFKRVFSVNSNDEVSGTVLATYDEALDGTLETKLMNPVYTRMLIESILHTELDINDLNIITLDESPVYSFAAEVGTINETVSSTGSLNYQRNGKMVASYKNEAYLTSRNNEIGLLVAGGGVNELITSALDEWQKETLYGSVSVNYTGGFYRLQCANLADGIISEDLSTLSVNSDLTLQLDIENTGTTHFGFRWLDIGTGTISESIFTFQNGTLLDDKGNDVHIERFASHSVITLYLKAPGAAFSNLVFRVTSIVGGSLRNIHLEKGFTSGRFIENKGVKITRPPVVVSRMVDFNPLHGTIVVEFGLNKTLQRSSTFRPLITMMDDSSPEFLSVGVMNNSIKVIDDLGGIDFEVPLFESADRNVLALSFASSGATGVLSVSINGGEIFTGNFVPRLRYSESLRVMLGGVAVTNSRLDGYLFNVDVYDKVSSDTILKSLSNSGV